MEDSQSWNIAKKQSQSWATIMCEVPPSYCGTSSVADTQYQKHNPDTKSLASWKN